MYSKLFNENKSNLRNSTLCFLIRGDLVLLAMKKRGFGKDKWNGVGGKCNLDETIEDAAIRETKEEIDVKVLNLEQKAVLDFYFENNKNWNQRVYVFLVRQWTGEPKETEEMAPKWFNKDSLPLDKMWEDDIFWLPLILKGCNIYANFLFGKDDKLINYKVNKISPFNKKNNIV